MTTTNFGRRGSLLASAAVGLLLLAGCSAGNGQTSAGASGADSGAARSASPASPTPNASTASATATSPAPATVSPQALPTVLPKSTPASLSIPAIGVQTELLGLGLRENKSLQVPPDGPGAPAGWYNGSPTPGERGPAVLLGHVNAVGGGPGVFANLRSLTPGTPVSIQRTDGSTATFTVDRAAAYGKDAFPTLEVYGNTTAAELRLITCDGYDPATGLFDDNYVVYATLQT
ncbi:class F sortase [Arthrobacter sp. H16F315]|uniref:class F sortase n=1 Tax=Arthrobacter sp. H16F315 TaxID=2955314 RepID=UPI0020981067|nr:class F sortase [Arthrobacter sp. H16F315]MDD1477735.1 class F sortase [Arthrobacter sp. H16F315]